MATVDTEKLAEAMYNGYGEKRGWRVASGAPMPRWNEQSPEFREGWKAAADAGLDHLRQAGQLH